MGENEKVYKYDAFISYRHLEPDQSIAKEIHRMIERFTPPKEFYKEGKKPSYRVFRDREELAARDLSSSIEEALKESRFLIVICGKRTALSDWCVKEIETFRKLHGDSRIIPVLIEGEPKESFPLPLKQLKREGKGFEPEEEQGTKETDFSDVLAADLRPKAVKERDFPGYEVLEKEDREKLSALRKESLQLLKEEKYRIMAAILSCNFGDLKQRDKERRNRLILRISFLTGFVFLIFALFMTNAYHKAEKARQEAVQSNTRILLKTAGDIAKGGDFLQSVLLAEDAVKPITKKMSSYEALHAEEEALLNDAVYHSGSSPLTSIATKNKMTYMALSHDERYFAYGLDNDKAAIAKVENGEVVRIFKGHSQQVKLLSFSPDDAILATASFDNRCILYDVHSGEEKGQLSVPGAPMLLRFSDDGSMLFYLTFTSTTADFYVYDTATWKLKSSFKIADTVKYASFKKDGTEVLVLLGSDSENKLTRRSLKDGSIIESIAEETVSTDQKEYPLSYRAAVYSEDQKGILLVTDYGIKKRSLEDGSIVFSVDEDINMNANSRLPFQQSADGKKIALQSYSKVFLIDGESGEITDEIYFPELSMKYFSYNAEQSTLVGFGESGKYSVWKAGKIVEEKLDYGGTLPSEFYFLKDGTKLLANSHDGQTIKILDMQSRVAETPLNARIIASSDDGSKMVLFDGSNFLLTSDQGKTAKKVEVDQNFLFGLMKSTKNHTVSNDGRYYASVWQKAGSGLPVLLLYDTEKDEKRELDLQSVSPNLRFSEDGKSIYLQDEKEGVKVYNTADLSEKASYPAIKDSAESILLSSDEKILAVNRYTGVVNLYDLESKKKLEDVQGEGVWLSHEGGEILLKGILNNSLFRYSSVNGTEITALDEVCAETPVSFDDRNFYNEKKNLLLLIRNNDTERKVYLIDFATGKSKFVLSPSVSRYDLNGQLSTDGETLIVDQNFYPMDYKDKDSKDSFSAGVYHILSKEEVKRAVEEMLSGRTLTAEEKEEIGITN